MSAAIFELYKEVTRLITLLGKFQQGFLEDPREESYRQVSAGVNRFLQKSLEKTQEES